MKKHIKKQNINKYYGGSKGRYSRKRTDAFTKGEIFSFEIQVKRKNGKIYLKEISNNRSIYSSISESVRNDTSLDVMLAKSHLMREIVMELEKGFDRLENPIGSRKLKDSTNDFQFKKAA